MNITLKPDKESESPQTTAPVVIWLTMDSTVVYNDKYTCRIFIWYSISVWIVMRLYSVSVCLTVDHAWSTWEYPYSTVVIIDSAFVQNRTSMSENPKS